jgi:hypothetical protein
VTGKLETMVQKLQIYARGLLSKQMMVTPEVQFAGERQITGAKRMLNIILNIQNTEIVRPGMTVMENYDLLVSSLPGRI